jgi:hypothetical protein
LQDKNNKWSLPMLNDIFKEVLVDQIGRLDYGNQRRVLDFAKALASAGRKGVPGKQLLSFAGVIPPEDLGEMRNAIEEHCEKVDRNEW